MQVIDLIGKVLCIFVLVVIIIALIVMSVWMISNMNDKE